MSTQTVSATRAAADRDTAWAALTGRFPQLAGARSRPGVAPGSRTLYVDVRPGAGGTAGRFELVRSVAAAYGAEAVETTITGSAPHAAGVERTVFCKIVPAGPVLVVITASSCTCHARGTGTAEADPCGECGAQDGCGCAP